MSNLNIASPLSALLTLSALLGAPAYADEDMTLQISCSGGDCGHVKLGRETRSLSDGGTGVVTSTGDDITVEWKGVVYTFPYNSGGNLEMTLPGQPSANPVADIVLGEGTARPTISFAHPRERMLVAFNPEHTCQTGTLEEGGTFGEVLDATALPDWDQFAENADYGSSHGHFEYSVGWSTEPSSVRANCSPMEQQIGAERSRRQAFEQLLTGRGWPVNDPDRLRFGGVVPGQAMGLVEWVPEPQDGVDGAAIVGPKGTAGTDGKDGDAGLHAAVGLAGTSVGLTGVGIGLAGSASWRFSASPVLIQLGGAFTAAGEASRATIGFAQLGLAGDTKDDPTTDVVEDTRQWGTICLGVGSADVLDEDWFSVRKVYGASFYGSWEPREHFRIAGFGVVGPQDTWDDDPDAFQAGFAAGLSIGGSI